MAILDMYGSYGYYSQAIYIKVSLYVQVSILHN